MQPAPAVTLTAPVPPEAGIVTLVGVTLYVQAAPACETVKVLPAIVIVPVRAAPVFAAAL